MLPSMVVVLLGLAGAQDLSATAQEAPRYSGEQLTSDLEGLREDLEKNHGGLYRYRDPSQLGRHFQQALDEVQEGMTRLEFFASLTRYVAAVQCGHTRARLPEQWREEVLWPDAYFPLVVRFVERRMFVLEDRSASPSIAGGTEVLAIDDRTVDQLLAQILPHLSADGWIESSKIRSLEDQFAYYLKWFVPQPAADFKVEIRTSAQAPTQSVELVGVPTTQLQGTRERARRPTGLSLEVDSANSLATLAISSFDPDLESADGLKFADFLQHAFQRLCDSEIDHLILDLRDNGGGDDLLGALLVSYLTEEEFGYFERIEVTERYVGQGQISRDDAGRRLVTTHPGTQLQYPSDPVFFGNLYVLINGRSFSTCADVATVLHHHGLATFVGEETGGGYDGNTSGFSRTHVLSNTRIGVSVPRWMYTTANQGHAFPGRGVPPDHRLEWAIDDRLQGRDTQMEFTRRLVLEGR
jgi:hypothetical protein